MENIFAGLNAVNGEVKKHVKSVHSNIRVTVMVKLTKGSLQAEFNVWADIINSKYQGYITAEDIEYDTNSHYTLGGMKVDSIYDFRETLKKGGLSTVAESLQFTSAEICNAFYEAIQEDKKIMNFFGKGLKVLELVSKEERTKLELDFVIARYDTIYVGSKTQFGIEFDKEAGDAPTLEQLIEYRNSLK